MLQVWLLHVVDQTQNPLNPILYYLLNYGVLAIVVIGIAFGFVVPKPSVDKQVVDASAAVQAAQDERDRALADKVKAEAQRDEAMQIAQEKIVPLLTTFVATVQTLLPILQSMAQRQIEDTEARAGRRDRRNTGGN